SSHLAFSELFRGVLLGNSWYFFRENSPEVLRLTLVLLYALHERSGSMTFVSLAQATRSLGIDAKTLHRWLADAPLPLQSHHHAARARARHPSGSDEASQDGQASSQAHTSCSPLSSRSQAAQQVGSCHPSRRVWARRTLRRDLPQARAAPA